jgi:hypothetical protein
MGRGDVSGQDRRARRWWAGQDSNLQPDRYERCSAVLSRRKALIFQARRKSSFYLRSHDLVGILWVEMIGLGTSKRRT